MKSLKWFVLLVAMLAIFIYAQDARTRAYIHAMLIDSAAVMRATVSDSCDSVRSTVRADAADSAAVYAGDTADVLRAEFRDTTTVVWVESIAVVRPEFRDTATVVWVESVAVVRGELRDSATVVWVDSASVMRGDIGDTGNVLRAEMIDSARVPLVADWAAGDFDITGLEKVEADTTQGTTCLESLIWLLAVDGVVGTGTIVGNILHVEPPVYIGTGDADSTMISDGCIQTDSVQVDDWLKVDDSLLIPSWAAAPATGSSGLFGADTANDTIVAYIGGTRAIVYPASGAGASAASVHDSCDAVRSQIRDSATVVWVDSAGIILREDGSNALTGDWAAGDFDVTGLEKLEADTLEGTVYTNTALLNAEAITSSGPATADSVKTNHITLGTVQILWATYRDTATVVFNDSIAVVTVPRTLVWYYDGDVATGTQFGMTYIPEQALTVNDIKLHVETAPVGASLIVDINEAGTTIFSTNPEIDAAATREDDNHAISDNTIAAGAEVTLDIDQVGSSTAGASLTVILECEQATTR